MVEEEPGSVENDLPAVEPPPRHDFSVVQGFQVVDAEDDRSARAGDEAWREALKLELEARAERLRQAVDAAIVLSNDGIIRWLGDPVAKLSPGPNALNPSAVIFADECLPDVPRETIKTRIELWIAATTRRLLAPLFALEGLQEGPEIVRDLAHELVRSLGVLEREPIKAKIRALSQDDRAELRKQGVRFGAYYLFLPMLLKPAARTLALQMWGLQASGDANEVVRTLAPVASSGRTSLSSDKGIGKEGYRVAGYRTCGERVVRVDVVERLAGMIRAAIAGEAPGGADGPPGQRTSKGFVVSGAMTSLTGCSGEQFASILRSMGFRSVEMRRRRPDQRCVDERRADIGQARILIFAHAIAEAGFTRELTAERKSDAAAPENAVRITGVAGRINRAVVTPCIDDGFDKGRDDWADRIRSARAAPNVKMVGGEILNLAVAERLVLIDGSIQRPVQGQRQFSEFLGVRRSSLRPSPQSSADCRPRRHCSNC